MPDMSASTPSLTGVWAEAAGAVRIPTINPTAGKYL
jgi:hypothetical protein